MRMEKTRMLVTGSSAGIGLAIARLARERGARVVLNGRRQGPLDSAARELDCPAVCADVGSDEDARRLVAEAAETLGGLDILVNNAGWGERMPVEAFDGERALGMWRTNVLGAALVTRESIAHLKRAGGGSIVNIASTAGLRGYPEGSAYVATKFALRGMTECWRAELRPHDIRVMLVNPSEVQTGFGGRDPKRSLDPGKLISEDIAHAVISALDMEPRGFIPELTVFATNPWKGV
ncbi:MAG: SDR family oxidoreductase [Planctomycetota bacterium]